MPSPLGNGTVILAPTSPVVPVKTYIGSCKLNCELATGVTSLYTSNLLSEVVGGQVIVPVLLSYLIRDPERSPPPDHMFDSISHDVLAFSRIIWIVVPPVATTAVTLTLPSLGVKLMLDDVTLEGSAR